MFWSPEICFVHIPKNAGRSIETELKGHLTGVTVLNQDYGLHAPISAIREKYDVKESFAVVRDPRDRIVSIWAHYFSEGLAYKRLLKAYGGDIPPKATLGKDRGLKWWLFDFIPKNPIKDIHRAISPLVPQTYWIDDSVRIFRFEELDKLIPYLKRFGIHKLQHIGQGNRPHWSQVHDEETLAWTYETFKEDFRRWYPSA